MIYGLKTNVIKEFEIVGNTMGNECRVEILKDLPKKQEHISQFLKKTVKQYVELNTHFYRWGKLGKDKMADLPLSYGEFQNQAIFFLAMDKAHGDEILAFPEHPYEIRRKRGRNNSKRLDYWVVLPSADTVLLIEYKHTDIALKQKGEGILANDLGWLEDSWKDNKNNLDATRNLSARNYMTMNGVIRHVQLINFAIVPISVTLEVEETVSETEETISNIIKENEKLLGSFDRIQETMKLKPKPNWVARWAVPADYQEQEWRGTRQNERFCAKYPVVFFLAHVEQC